MADKFKGIAIALNNRIHVPETIKRIQLCDDLGFEEVWIPYHVSGTRGLWSVAGAALQATKQITIGLGIAVPYLQDPIVCAQDSIALDEIGGGRFILGLGSALWVIQRELGIFDKKPIRYMREYIEILRALFNGEAAPEVQMIKYPKPAQLQYKPANPNIPVYLGPVNPQMLRLSGRIADGVKLGALCSPPYIRRSVGYLTEGMKKGNRDPSQFSVGGNVMVSINDDFDTARKAMRNELGYYVQRVEKIILEDTGIPQEDIQAVKDAFDKGGRPAAAEVVTEQMIDILAVAGDPEYCVKRLKDHAKAGLQILHAWNIDTNVDPSQTIRLIAKHLRPELVEK